MRQGIGLERMYSEVPSLYWYTTKSDVTGETMYLFTKGRQYVGYNIEPDDDVVYRDDLVYIAYGTFEWLESYIRSERGEREYAL